MLARIVTSSTAQSEQLEQELRRQGYEVETVAAGTVSEGPADLEIDLREYTVEEALRKAEEIAGAENLPVFIASGAFHEAPDAALQPAPMQQAAEFPLPASQPSELQELISELETVMPQLEPPGENSAWAMASEAEPLSDWPIWQPPLAEVAPEPAPETSLDPAGEPNITPAYAMSPDAVVVRSRVSFWNSVREQLPMSEKMFWRTAIGVASLAVVALVAVALFHRFSPLPAQVSSQAVEITAPAVAAPTAEPKPASQPLSPGVLKPAVIHSPVSYSQEADVVAPDSVVHYGNDSKASPRHSSRHTSDHDIVAQDTITRYNKQPNASTTSAAQDSEVKRYSDLK